MKKGLITLLAAICAVSVSIPVARESAAAEVTPQTTFSQSFTDDFEGYAERKYGSWESFGDWNVHISGAGSTSYAEITQDPMGTRGKVLHLYDISGGNYVHASYKKQVQSTGVYDFNARNFTVRYDFYTSQTAGGTGWCGLFARDANTEVAYPSAYTAMLLLQKGRGDGSELIVGEDGELRETEKTDYYFQYAPYVAMATGSADGMRDEGGIPRSFGRLYNKGGGNLAGTWYSVQFEVKDNSYTASVKYADEDESAWRELGTAYFNDSNGDFFSGGIALSCMLTDFYVDDFTFISEDGQAVTLSGGEETGCVTTAGQSTATENSTVRVTMSPADGYTFGNLYTDAAKTKAVTPVGFKLQYRRLNTTYAKYEWLDVEDVEITSFADFLQKTTEEDYLYDVYNGSEYRLVVSLKTAENGYTYFADYKALDYKVKIYVGENGLAVASGFGETLENGAILGRLLSGESVALTATAESGYLFAGWFLEETVNGEAAFTKVSDEAAYALSVAEKNITVKACFVEESTGKATVALTQEITKPVEEVYGETVGSGEYYEGVGVTLIAKPATGYSFIGWYDGDEMVSEEAYFTVEIDGDIAYCARFEIETYRIFVLSTLLDSERIEEVENGSIVTLTATNPPYGYEFIGWTIVGAEDYEVDIDSRTVTFAAENKQITARAQYAPKTFKVGITYGNAKAGAALGAGTYQCGTKVTIRPILNEGYDVSKFTVRGVDVTVNADGTCSFIMPAENVVVRIDFVDIDHVEIEREITVMAVFAVLAVTLAGVLIFRNKKKGE